jgi:hypothetical protein
LLASFSRVTPTRSPIYSACDEPRTEGRVRFLATYKDPGDEPPIQQAAVVNQQEVTMQVVAGEAARGTFAAEIDVEPDSCVYYYFRFVDSRDRIHRYPAHGDQLLFSGSPARCGYEDSPLLPPSVPTADAVQVDTTSV